MNRSFICKVYGSLNQLRSFLIHSRLSRFFGFILIFFRYFILSTNGRPIFFLNLFFFKSFVLCFHGSLVFNLTTSLICYSGLILYRRLIFSLRFHGSLIVRLIFSLFLYRSLIFRLFFHRRLKRFGTFLRNRCHAMKGWFHRYSLRGFLGVSHLGVYKKCG